MQIRALGAARVTELGRSRRRAELCIFQYLSRALSIFSSASTRYEGGDGDAPTVACQARPAWAASASLTGRRRASSVRTGADTTSATSAPTSPLTRWATT
eukprot:6203782-Pleurochrysis_carterae.AAC.2